MLIKTIKLYENREDVTLTTYVIAEKGEMREIGKRPGVIICPGGAYLGCSDREAEPVALKFASMGYHAFVLRYSVYDEGSNRFPGLKELPVKEHCKHPAPVREIGKSMLIIREYAEEWMVDMEKIAICGFSAGAHNSAMYATQWHTQLISDYLQVEPELLRPAAVILCYTLSDYTIVKETAEKSPITAPSNTAFFGEANPSDEKLKEVSPCMHVTEQTPPIFLWATAEDEAVLVQHSLRMAHALADHKIPFELHIFEEGEHGLGLATQASAVVKSQINKDAAQWVALAEAWLEKRFALKLKTP